jgi:outer membrane receptor protein involved in Fe transport
MVANKPDPSTLAAGVTGESAWTKGGSPSREIEGFLNAPLVRDRAAVRAVAYYDLQGGYLDDVALRLSDVDQTTRVGGRLAARVLVSDAWQVDASAAIQRLRSSDTQYTTAGLRPGLRSNRTREAHDNDFALGSIAVTGDLGFAKLASSTGYVRHDFASRYNATAETSDILNTFPVMPNDVGVYSESTRIRRLVQDVVLTSTGDGKLHWLAGVYGSVSKERTPSSLLVRQASGFLNEVYSENRNDKVKDLAVYGEISYAFAPGWTASAGGRLFRTHLRTNSDIVVAPCGVCQSRNVIGTHTYRGFSPKVSIQYEFASGPLVYALFSEGYRAGGFNSTGLSNIRDARASFVPDQLRNYEIGAKGRFMDGRLVLRAAAFYDRWTDIQSDWYRPSGLAYTANVGDARIPGLETEIAYDFDFGLSLQANALFAEPEFTHTNPDFSQTPLDSGLPGAPRTSGGFLARYERPLGGGFTLRLIGEASYIGASRLTFQPSTTTRTGAFVEARLSAEIAAQRWSAALFVTNPTNDQGDTFAYGNPFTFGKVRQVTPQRPRTIGLRLGAAF